MKNSTSVRKNGGTFYLRVPPAFVEHLGLKEGEDVAEIQDEEGKHGKFCSFWLTRKK